MTNSLKEQAVEQLKAKHEAENKAREEKEQAAKETLERSREKNKKKDKPKYEIDKMQLYLGEPYKLNDKITIYQPTVGDIIRIGEQKCYSVIHIFTANTTSYRMFLWEAGYDWCKMTNFQLFTFLAPTLKQEDTKFLFGDLDFSKLELYQVTEPETEKTYIIMYDPEQDITIDEATCDKLTWYIRTIFNIFPKEEFGKGKATKEALIWEDQQNYEKHKDDPYESVLFPLISSCLNHPGFKYTKKELMDVGIVEFMDSVQRLQIYESSTALMKGMYSGFIDTKGIKPDQYNFMRNLDVEY